MVPATYIPFKIDGRTIVNNWKVENADEIVQNTFSKNESLPNSNTTEYPLINSEDSSLILAHKNKDKIWQFSHEVIKYCKKLHLEIDVQPFREYFENEEYQPIWHQFQLKYNPDNETATAEYCWIILWLGMLKLNDDYTHGELDEEWTAIMNNLWIRI
jgi:hypothetical protein